MKRALLLVPFLAACGVNEPELGTLLVQNNSPERTVVRVAEADAPLDEGRQLNKQPIPPLSVRTFVVDVGCRWFSAWLDNGNAAGSKQCVEPGKQLIMNVGNP